MAESEPTEIMGPSFVLTAEASTAQRSSKTSETVSATSQRGLPFSTNRLWLASAFGMLPVLCTPTYSMLHYCTLLSPWESPGQKMRGAKNSTERNTVHWASISLPEPRYKPSGTALSLQCSNDIYHLLKNCYQSVLCQAPSTHCRIQPLNDPVPQVLPGQYNSEENRSRREGSQRKSSF